MIRSADVRALSIHAGYACRRSGACCSSHWPIPIEADRLARVRGALANGRIRLDRDGSAPFVTHRDDDAEMSVCLATSDGRCVFLGHDADDRLACRIQSTLGHDALPLACRQFPRVSVRDPRGVSVSLSAYCPTVASLLAIDAPLEIVTAPPAFPDAGECDGLDAQHSLPPALRPDVLMDWESWWTWEAGAIACIAACADPGEAIARLRVAVEHARGWSPGDGPLPTRICDAFERARSTSVDNGAFDRAAATRRRGDVIASIPDSFMSLIPTARDKASAADPVALRFVAAHAFGNWTAHLGAGLRTWLRSIETPAALLALGLDVRQADLCLRHLADPTALARVWSRAERGAM